MLGWNRVWGIPALAQGIMTLPTVIQPDRASGWTVNGYKRNWLSVNGYKVTINAIGYPHGIPNWRRGGSQACRWFSGDQFWGGLPPLRGSI